MYVFNKKKRYLYIRKFKTVAKKHVAKVRQALKFRFDLDEFLHQAADATGIPYNTYVEDVLDAHMLSVKRAIFKKRNEEKDE